MEDKTYEARQQWSLLYIFIVVFVSSLPLPFWFHSVGFKFTNVVDANERHYIFLLCNVILVFLSFYSRTKDSSQTQSQLDDHMPIIVNNADDLPKQVAIDERPKAEQMECNEISVSSVLEEETEVETEHVSCADFPHEIISTTEVEEEEEGHIGTSLVDVDDHGDQTDNMEIESFVHAEYDHELILTSEAETEEEGHDDQEEDVNELNQKCDAFIHRMRLNMHLEANSSLEIDSRKCHLCEF
ncbi:hypothetical protein CTI12_AA610700 [Artemisia annua]|uniref:Uncharacterized protein n=1 Tax=Artemisia annua TaxID=35608 RepID=A0A2U1KEV1_ARTAN|nr:hypothetical protein CTI12_AA610700 [Artemisia annua]